MPDPGRVVEVVGGASRGTGYLIARGLVLTAWHVARPSPTQPERPLGVRLLRDATRRREANRPGPDPTYAATRLWPLADLGPALDFALLHAEVPAELADGPLHWSRLESFGAQSVAAIGLPDARIKDNIADTLAVEGRVLAGTDLKAQAGGDGTITLRLLQEDAADIELVGWQGMSGAAVFAGSDLVAIVRGAWSEKPYTALKVLPVERLFRTSEAREAIRAARLPLLPERARNGRDASAVYDFSTSINAWTRGFVGRDWLFAQLDQFRAEHASGYFSIEADAGLGKTALAASFARRYRAPAFFFSATEGRVRLDLCLKHFAAELDGRLGRESGLTPDRAAQDWGYVGEQLERLTAADSKPILLIIDGLDEAEPSPFGNTLLLPTLLPEGVHVVLTSRTPPSLSCEAGTALCRVTLAPTDTAHRGDVRAFLAAQVPDRQLRAALEQASEGNFMYLRYVLADLKGAAIDALRPGALPRGLAGYYERFWAGIQAARNAEGWTDWNGLYRPTITILAAALEPVSAAWIGAMLGRPADEIEERALERWRRFLARGGSGRWRIVHRSFADFLAVSGIDLPGAHGRIAEHLLQGWGGLEAGLPGLPPPGRHSVGDQYGLQHLAQHLRMAGDTVRLTALVRERLWQTARIAQDPSGGLYQTDWQHCGSALGASNLAAVVAGAAVDVAAELECALSVASLNAISSHFSAKLLKSFVETGYWSPATALAAARLNPEKDEGAQSIAVIAPYLDATLIEATLLLVDRPSEAGAALGAVLHRLSELGEPDRAFAIANGRPCFVADLADCLPDRLLKEAIAKLREEVAQAPDKRTIPDPPVEAWAALLAHAPPAVLKDEQALGIVPRGANDLLAAIARRWASLGEWKAANAALRRISSKPFRGVVLADMIEYAPESERQTVVNEALNLVSISRQFARADVLRAIVPYLDPGRATVLLQECLPKEKIMSGERTISTLASVLPAALMREAREAIRAIASSYPGEPCGALAIRLAELGLVDEAIEMAGTAGDSYEVGTAMSALVPRLAALGHKARAAKLATEMHQYGRDEFVPKLFADVSRHVSLPELTLLEAYARAIESDRDRKRALNGMAVGYALNGQPDQALSLASLLDDRDDQSAFLGQVAFCWGDPMGLSRPDLALAEAVVLPTPALRTRVLEALAPSLPAAEAAEAIEHLLCATEWNDLSARLVQPNAWRALLARLCAVGGLEQAWAFTLRAPELYRYEFQAQVAASCPEPLRNKRLRSILAEMRQDDGTFHSELRAVIGYFDAELLLELSRALPKVNHISEDEFVSHVAERLIALGHKQDGIEIAFAVSAFHAANAVSSRADCLDAQDVRQCLSALVGAWTGERAIPSLLRRLAAVGEPGEALLRVHQLEGAQQMKALAAIIPELSGAELDVAATLAGVVSESTLPADHQSPNDDARRALAAVAARHAELGHDAVALDLIERLPYWWNGREGALASIAAHIPSASIERGLALCKAPDSMAAFLPRLAEQGVGQARRALLLACDFPEQGDRAAAFYRLLPLLLRLPTPDLYALWSEAAHALARRPRQEVLRDLGLLLPLYARVGGPPALAGAALALERIAARWP